MPRESSVAVTTTASLVLANPLAGANTSPIALLVENTGAATVFIGGDLAVTAANGVPIAANGSMTLVLAGGESAYAITGAGTSTLAVLSQAGLTPPTVAH